MGPHRRRQRSALIRSARLEKAAPTSALCYLPANVASRRGNSRAKKVELQEPLQQSHPSRFLVTHLHDPKPEYQPGNQLHRNEDDLPSPISSCTSLISWTNFGTVSMRSNGRNHR